MNSPLAIKRVGPPNAYDKYPWGTICIVNDGSLYRQISKNEENPVWDRFSDDYPEGSTTLFHER